MFSILNPDGFQLLGMEILKSPITNSPESRASCKKLAAQKKGQIHWVSCFNDNKKKQFQESCHPITAKPQNSLFLSKGLSSLPTIFRWSTGHPANRKSGSFSAATKVEAMKTLTYLAAAQRKSQGP